MEDEIDKGEEECQRMTVHKEGEAQDDGADAHTQITLQGTLGTDAHYECVLTRLTVGITVTEIIHQQQGVDHQATGY